MNDLIRITNQTIGEEEINAVDGRELHAFLEVETRFDTWVERKIEKYKFLINSDFCSYLSRSPNGGRPSTEYTISLDMAKQLSMLEDNEKGQQARQYFIQCEKELKSQTMIPTKTLSPVAKELHAAIRIAKYLGLSKNQAILSANRTVKNLTGCDCMQIMQVTHLESTEKEIPLTPTDIGSQFKISGQKTNKKLAEIGLQEGIRVKKGALKWVPTEKGKEFAILKDTGKKHTDGTPVTQLFWKTPVLDLLKENCDFN